MNKQSCHSYHLALEFRNQHQPSGCRRAPHLFISSRIELWPIGRVLIEIGLHTYGYLSYRFSGQCRVELRIVAAFPINHGLSERIPAYNPEELLFGNVFQFLVLQYPGTDSGSFTGRQMYGNISLKREPDGEYAQIMLFIQTNTVFELFLEILSAPLRIPT